MLVLLQSFHLSISIFFDFSMFCQVNNFLSFFRINYKGKDLSVPLDLADPKKEIGPFTEKLYEEILKIQYGEVESEWSVIV